MTAPKIEVRGVRCIECRGLSDLKADLDLLAAGFGRCATPMEHFVAFAMSRNCMDFEPAPKEVVAKRDRWVEENVTPFWRKK